jgi:hypothetical protein
LRRASYDGCLLACHAYPPVASFEASLPFAYLYAYEDSRNAYMDS